MLRPERAPDRGDFADDAARIMVADLFAQFAARGPPVGAGMKPPVKVDAAWPKDIDIPKEVENDDTVPRELCCPISLCLMRNPTMVGTSGYT